MVNCLKVDLMGLVLHPLDLATNKILAMAGRMEPRDWIDVLNVRSGQSSLSGV